MKEREPDPETSPDPPGSGAADPGVPFDPTSLPDDQPFDPEHDVPRAAPSPGSPLPDDEVERLKSEAANAPPPDDVPGQADPTEERKRQ
jgi:hypothetical protein